MKIIIIIHNYCKLVLTSSFSSLSRASENGVYEAKGHCRPNRHRYLSSFHRLMPSYIIIIVKKLNTKVLWLQL